MATSILFWCILSPIFDLLASFKKLIIGHCNGPFHLGSSKWVLKHLFKQTFTILGQFLCQFFGDFCVEFEPNYGQWRSNFWPKLGQFLNHFWIIFGLYFAPIFGQFFRVFFAHHFLGHFGVNFRHFCTKFFRHFKVITLLKIAKMLLIDYFRIFWCLVSTARARQKSLLNSELMIMMLTYLLLRQVDNVNNLSKQTIIIIIIRH